MDKGQKMRIQVVVARGHAPELLQLEFKGVGLVSLTDAIMSV